MRKLLLAAAGLWVGRWAALKLAGRLGRFVPPRSGKDSPRQPGRMPGPFDV